MIVGDSISAGPGCYKKYLLQQLQAAGITNFEFVGGMRLEHRRLLRFIELRGPNHAGVDTLLVDMPLAARLMAGLTLLVVLGCAAAVVWCRVPGPTDRITARDLRSQRVIHQDYPVVKLS